MEDYISVRDFLEFSKRHRARILKTVAGSVALVLGATYFLMTPVYEAEAVLLVKFGREYMYRPELGDRDAIGGALNKDRQLAQINSELAILRSQELLADVVTQVGVARLYPALAEAAAGKPAASAAAARLLSNLTAYNVKDSDIIRVRVDHAEPELAAQTANVLIDKFMAKHLVAFSDAATTAFLEQKVASSRKELQQAEEKLKAFQMRTGSFSADEQRAALFTQRDELEAKRKTARSQVAGLDKRLAYLQAEKTKVSADTSRFSSEETKAVSDARAQLLELQLQEQKLLATFSEKSRAVENVRGQIRLVEEFLAQQRATVGQGQFADDLEKQIIATQAELRFQAAQADTLGGQIASLERQIAESTQSSAEYRDLVRDREAGEKNYAIYSKKLEEFRASEEMDRQKIANISVIQAASVPLAPIWPDKKLNLLFGLVMGVAAGYGWALALELRQRRDHPEAAVVPVDQETLVAPGTVHWRKVLQGTETRVEDAVAPNAAKESRGA